MLPGTPARASHDYVRHRTSSLYAALEVTTGKVIGALHGRHRAREFLAFLKTIEANVRADLDVHLVLDNASTHKTPPYSVGSQHIPDSLCTALHPDQRLLAQPGRTLVRRTDHQETAPRRPHPGAYQLNADIRAWIDTLEPQSPPLRMDQDRRPNPGQHRQLLQPN